MRDLKTAVRTKRITVRLSPGELEELKRKAKLEGYTVADYVRIKVLRAKAKRRVEACRKALSSLSRIGGLLNQIARYCHQRRDIDAYVAVSLAEIQKAVWRIAEALSSAGGEEQDADEPSGGKDA